MLKDEEIKPIIKPVTQVCRLCGEEFLEGDNQGTDEKPICSDCYIKPKIEDGSECIFNPLAGNYPRYDKMMIEEYNYAISISRYTGGDYQIQFYTLIFPNGFELETNFEDIKKIHKVKVEKKNLIQ